MKIYSVHLTQTNLTFAHSNRTSLLETLEANNVRHEYQCRSGYCGSCRTKIKKGKVSYKETPLAFVNSDEILLCCCQLESDVELEL
ncbi:class I ribonucleotide reductase maintenance protein YfaE [Bisgaard Taxon 10/6]|uniref:class I ribonucleotide reductase maintenance protein YfaE n=1 Tax=Exercitatus varius TaxID=67857 RepID=UPI00294B1732|nr:class I ribonucleotide reductase maintenance protein YfaE [Exercitatus varius]MDG2916711.1 class I ribonucleotide reductase maintenance protein YfaE [Exercitatus varius]MDG2941424.1 class I ribonucleotide reductase maintenance protein YfaE [Exercitatus varius]MDG2955412.1 class I ribonucleotide reductase maintenance protein YfaE [Exercitatus varius]MDG2963693.1 class I ribonucleotide reductase maintenance protein YfaE [Exercitatus varius]